MAAFFTLLFLGFVFFFVLKKKTTPLEKPVSPTVASIGIPMTAEETELERQYNEEVIGLLEKNIIKSGLFKTEKIPELISILRKGSAPFARLNTKIAFEGEIFLTVEEKRAFGLNTRMKYSKKFIEYFTPSALKTIEPKSTLEHMHLRAFHKVARKKEISQFKKLGFINRVEVIFMDDGDDCLKIKQAKKIYNLEEVPELPLPGCDAAFCRCYYSPVINKG